MSQNKEIKYYKITDTLSPRTYLQRRTRCFDESTADIKVVKKIRKRHIYIITGRYVYLREKKRDHNSKWILYAIKSRRKYDNTSNDT